MKKRLTLFKLLLKICVLAVCAAGCHAPSPGYIKSVDDNIQQVDKKVNEAYQAGRYDEAARHMLEIIKLIETSEGYRPASLLKPLNNLASLYEKNGENGKAELIYLRIIDIMSDSLGESHPLVGVHVGELADFYIRIGKTETAEHYCLRAIDILERADGKESMLLVQPITSLALLLERKKNVQEAEELLVRALNITIAASGVDHPLTLQAKGVLADYYSRSGQNEKAGKLYNESSAIAARTLGERHPLTDSCTMKEAVFYWTSGFHEKAIDLLGSLTNSDWPEMEYLLGFDNPDEKMDYLAIKMRELYFFMHAAAAHSQKSPETLVALYKRWIRLKRMEVEAKRRFQGAYLYHAPDNIIQEYRAYIKLASALNRLVYLSFRSNPPSSYKDDMNFLLGQLNVQEQKIAELSPEFSRQLEKNRIDFEKIRRLTPDGRLILDFARIPEHAIHGSGNGFDARYIVFVISGSGSLPVMVDLGDAEAIDVAADEYSAVLSGAKQVEKDEKLQLSRNLCKLVWDPIARNVAGYSDILVSPDGALSQVPFETLLNGRNEFLIDRHIFRYAASVRDVEPVEKGKKAVEMVVITGPDAADGKILEIALRHSNVEVTHTPLDDYFSDPVLKPHLIHFASRPYGSETEFAGIDRTNPFTRIGFRRDSKNESGLHGADSEYGFFTAWDMLKINLSGVRTAFMQNPISAGKGEAKVAMQRALISALKQAGVQTQVVNLYNGDDEATRFINRIFYNNYLVHGDSPSIALRKAMLSLKARTGMRSGFYDPSIWGGWALYGLL